MPDTSLDKPSTLADEMRAHMGLFTEKTFDWDAFPASRGFPDLSRAQLRYVGAGGSPKVGDPSTMKAQHFTFSLVNQPVGKFAASHAHEVVEHFFILQGVLTVGTVWGDEVVEVKLGPKDLLLNKSGRPHGFRNDGVEPVLMQITVGSGTPEMPVHVCHPKDKELELSRRFGAPGPEKIHLFSPESTRPAAPGAGAARRALPRPQAGVGEGGLRAHGLCRRGRRAGHELQHGHDPSAARRGDQALRARGRGRVLRARGRDHRRLGAGRRDRRAPPRRARPDVQSGRPAALLPQRRRRPTRSSPW